jgi:hypothetical protein
MAEEQVEDQFFDKPEKEHTGGTGLFKPYKPPSMAAKIALVAVGAIVFGAILYFTAQKEDAVIWVMNPGPDAVQLQVAGNAHDLEAGKLLDAKVEVESNFELGAFRGDHAEDIKVELHPEAESVSLIDLGADAAYIILDVSPIYNSTEPPKTLPVLFKAKPQKVHQLPYPALKLVRPGMPIPEKGSWELTAAQAGSSVTEIYKVFRVDPKRLDDEAKLVEILTEGVLARKTADYENMRTFVDTKNLEKHEGIIPNLK